MRDPPQTPLVQACAYAALVLVSLAIALDAPEQLTGLPAFQALPYMACFVGAIWMSGFLIPSPWRLALTVAIATLVCTSVMQVFIQTHELKETVEALYPFGWKAGPTYMMLAFIIAASLMLVPLLVKRSYPAPDPLRLARALLISFGGMLAVVAALSFIEPVSRFFDPLKILLTPYIFPLLASAVAVLLWSFLRRQVLPKGSSNG